MLGFKDTVNLAKLKMFPKRQVFTVCLAGQEFFTVAHLGKAFGAHVFPPATFVTPAVAHDHAFYPLRGWCVSWMFALK
jgi:hypothetical protein